MKIKSYLLIGILAYLFLSSFSFATKIFAQTAQSECVLTKVGNGDANQSIPSDCVKTTTSTDTNRENSTKLSSILDYAKQINNALELGQVYGGNYYNRMVADISNGSYAAHKHQSDNSNDALTAYFCTDLVLDAYNLAGISGLTENPDLAVVNMVDYWRKTTNYHYLDYFHADTTDKKVTILSALSPGDAIFFEGILDVPTGHEHTAIISDVTVDRHGNGSIKTIDANAPQKTRTYTIEAGDIKNTYDTNAGCTNYDYKTQTPASNSGADFCKLVVGFGGIAGGAVPMNGSKPVIVLDPGHGPNFDVIDTATGLKMSESHNVPEITEVWNVAQKVKAKLESDGYAVLLTKQDVEGEGVTFRDRANVANNNNAALAVSIHDDHSQNFDSFKEIYPQEVDAYRGSGANKTIFTDAAIAHKSMDYANIFQHERQKVEGGSRMIKLNDSFNSRPGLEPGNIPIVQLFAKVPWVYNEVGGIGMGQSEIDKYAQSLINSIEACVPLK